MTPELIAAGTRLAEALARENAALAAVDFAAAGGLLAAKEAALAGFAAAQRQGGGPAEGGGPYRAATALAIRLRDLTQENRRLLDQSIAVQGRVLDSYAKAIARAAPRARASAYAASGARPNCASLPVVLSARV